MIKEKNTLQPIVGRLDIQLLRALIAVAKGPTISAAASRLNLTQPTLSLQIKRLEERAGRSLFEPSRQGRSRRLTSEGERLLHYAEQIIYAYDEAVLYLSSPQLTGELSIGLPDWLLNSHMSQILAEFKEMHSGLRLRVVSTTNAELSAMLQSELLHMSILTVNADEQVAGNSWQVPLHWVANDDLSCLKQDILPIGLCFPPCPLRDLTAASLSKVSRVWREEFVSDNFAAIKAAVSVGLVISALPETAISGNLKIIDTMYGLEPLPAIHLAVALSPSAHKLEHVETLIYYLTKFIEAKMCA